MLRPGLAGILTGLLVGLAIVFALRALGGDDDATIATPAGTPGVARTVVQPVTPAVDRQAIETSLEGAVAQAADRGGVATAAVMLRGWSEPVVASSGMDGRDHKIRMWSISKVATATTLLRTRGWGDHAGDPVDAGLASAVDGALRRSENCRQRRVVLALQEQLGGSARAAAEIEATFSIAEIDPTVAKETQGPDATCLGYLRGAGGGLRDPYAAALMLGTSRWTMSDAARFGLALGEGAYGSALTDRILTTMSAPKLRSHEVPPGEYTPRLDWGAGRALACASPAYKAGWGGSQTGDFVVEQLAIVRSDTHPAAIAVSFAPTAQPGADDPGRTVAPAAIETVMRRVAPDLAPERC